MFPCDGGSPGESVSVTFDYQYVGHVILVRSVSVTCDYQYVGQVIHIDVM